MDDTQFLYKVRTVVEHIGKKNYFETKIFGYVIEKETMQYYFYDNGRKMKKLGLNKFEYNKYKNGYEVTVCTTKDNLERAKIETLNMIKIRMNEDAIKLAELIALINTTPNYIFRNNKDSYE